MTNSAASAAFAPIVKMYLEILEETFERHHGYYLDRNTSLFETLDGISAERASVPVSARCAALSAQVEHTRFYIDVIAGAMRGNEPEGVDWNEIWRTVQVVTPEGWEASKQRLRASYEGLRELVQHPEEWASEESFGDAIAVLAHSAYHLGEIRQALCTLQ